MRVVSLCPSNTEIVAYLGKTDLLVGIDNYSDWPESVVELPKVGPDLSIDMDKVEALTPDLVLASLSVPGMEKNIEGLKERNLPFIILNPNSLQEIADDIRKVSDALHCSQLGDEKASEFLEEIEELQRKWSSTNEITLYWEWWPKPIFTPGRLNWLTEISSLAGARNIFDDHDVASVQSNWDEVKTKDPDHICMVWVGIKEEKMNPALLKKRPGWNEMKAIKENNIYILEESLYCRPSPRLLEGLHRLIKILHP